MMSIRRVVLLQKGLLVTALALALSSVAVAQTPAAPGGATGMTPTPPTAPPPVLPPAVKPGTETGGVSPMHPVTPPVVTPPAVGRPVTAPAAGVVGNPDGSCPESAPVKVSRSKIYHVPGSQNYQKTKAKHCFESAQAAEQAGYRAPKK